jgi:hypothetical protein
VSADGFSEWFMDIRVLDANPLYMNQTFRLKFKFTDAYPIGIVYPLSRKCSYKLLTLQLQKLQRSSSSKH